MSNRQLAEFPLAQAEGLLVEEVGDESVVYDARTGDAHCLAPLAAAVFARCDGSTSVEELAKLAGSRLGEPVDAERVDAALAQLEERNLLETPDGMTRRVLVRRTAVATAAIAATPLITSIATPAYAQGSPDPTCFPDVCASQRKGDDFCNVNGCGGVFRDSCECLNCEQLGDEGLSCPPQPGQPCSEVFPLDMNFLTNGGCDDLTGNLDGLCFRKEGDSSEPCE